MRSLISIKRYFEYRDEENPHTGVKKIVNEWVVKE
jgi:hypothetical protein